MSKYEKLWNYIKNCNEDTITLTFAEIDAISGVPLDHSFLRCKKDLMEYGWEVHDISLKAQSIRFHRIQKSLDEGELCSVIYRPLGHIRMEK